MSKRFSRGSRGYSVIELLIVVTMIGILSLISVPAFLNYRKSNFLKGSLRNFTADTRAVRQYAISQSRLAKIEFGTGDTTKRGYNFLESSDNGVTWARFTLGRPGQGTSTHQLEESYFRSTNYPDQNNPANTTPDIVFQPSGALWTRSGVALPSTPQLEIVGVRPTGFHFTVEVKPGGSVTSTRVTGD